MDQGSNGEEERIGAGVRFGGEVGGRGSGWLRGERGGRCGRRKYLAVCLARLRNGCRARWEMWEKTWLVGGEI